MAAVSVAAAGGAMARAVARIAPRIDGRDHAKIRAGASLVQLYTALAYDGPGLVVRLKTELLECLARDGHARLSDAVGVDA